MTQTNKPYYDLTSDERDVPYESAKKKKNVTLIRFSKFTFKDSLKNSGPSLKAAKVEMADAPYGLGQTPLGTGTVSTERFSESLSIQLATSYPSECSFWMAETRETIFVH